MTYDLGVVEDLPVDVAQVLDDRGDDTREGVGDGHLVTVRKLALQRLPQLLVGIVNGPVDGLKSRGDLVNGGLLGENLGVGSLEKKGNGYEPSLFLTRGRKRHLRLRR